MHSGKNRTRVLPFLAQERLGDLVYVAPEIFFCELTVSALHEKEKNNLLIKFSSKTTYKNLYDTILSS